MNPAQAAFDNPYLDTIISLVLVFALLSVFTSTLLEAWNRRVKERGVFLQKVIFRLLDDPLNKNFGYLIYQHPIINKMRKDGNSFPHYIPAEGFANALIDTVADEAVKLSFRATLNGQDVDVEYAKGLLTGAQRAQVVFKKGMGRSDVPLGDRLRLGVNAMADSELKRLFTNFIARNTKAVKPDPAGAEVQRLDMDSLKTELGRWFDDYMDRCTGEFKQNQRRKLMVAGLFVALVLNVDSIHLAKVFFMDKGMRDRMVECAEGVANAIETSRDTTEAGMRAAVLRKLSEMDTSRLANVRNDSILVKSLNFLFDDSALIHQRQRTDSLLIVLDQWQLPIGWSNTEAPSSWQLRTWCDQRPQTRPAEPLLAYFEARNRGSFTHLFLWVLGILITGMALSLGAPFWFEALVRLVNIRRSGPKPKTTSERNA